MFRCNVGGIDRAVRLAAGLLLLPAGLFLWGQGHDFGLVLAIPGLIGLATGASRFCPLYIPFGISTARAGARKTESEAPLHESRSPGRAAGVQGR